MFRGPFWGERKGGIKKERASNLIALPRDYVLSLSPIYNVIHLCFWQNLANYAIFKNASQIARGAVSDSDLHLHESSTTLQQSARQNHVSVHSSKLR